MKVPPRIAGLLLLVVSGCTTLLHRTLYEAGRHGPAQATEMGVGLLTFMLASAGVLMLIHGGKLFDGKLDPRNRQPAPPKRDIMSILTGPAVSISGACDTRQGVALLQARRALAAARHAYDNELSARNFSAIGRRA